MNIFFAIIGRSFNIFRAKFVLFISVYNNINFVTVYILYLIIIICNILLVFLIDRPNKYFNVYVSQKLLHHDICNIRIRIELRSKYLLNIGLKS